MNPSPSGVMFGLMIVDFAARAHMEEVERSSSIVIRTDFDAAKMGANGQMEHIGKQAQTKVSAMMPVGKIKAPARRNGRDGQTKPNSGAFVRSVATGGR